jgi:hypothetical protein
MAKARPPAERRILCTSCGEALIVAYKAQSVCCRHCNGRVVCEPFDIKDYVAVRNLRTANSMRLRKKAIVNAALWAEEIRVEGRLRGDAISLGGILITRTAEVVGGLRALTLVVEEGASLVGEMRIGRRHIPAFDRRVPEPTDAPGLDAPSSGAVGEARRR